MVIINGKVFPMEGNDIGNGYVRIKGTKIEEVGPMWAFFPQDSDDAIAAGITSVMIGPGSSNVVGGQFVFIKTQGRCRYSDIFRESVRSVYKDNVYHYKWGDSI